jgi:phospholipid/cholesterol/gamma-HCH transport system permease protein
MSEERLRGPVTLDRQGGLDLLDRAKRLKLTEGADLVLDWSETEDFDSVGGATVLEISRVAAQRGATVRFENARGKVARFLDLIEPGLYAGKQEKKRPTPWVASIGQAAIDIQTEAKSFGNLLVETVYWTFIAPFEGKSVYWSHVLTEINAMGVQAVRINCLMNFLLGLIIAMMSAAQLETLGLDIWVANLVMIAFARELAAIMTAVVVTARTGAAITAELATMTVQEEIDALRGMGFNVTQYLVTPRVTALLVVMPCLVAMGILCGVAGGAVWGVFVLDISLDNWLIQTLEAAEMGEVLQGLTKCFFFAAAIALIGCHNGLRVRGGSRGVGQMTTRAVVMDVFAIIVIDMAFAVVFYYMLD